MSMEPFGDQRRGLRHEYSDFVPDAQSVGYYTFFNGGELLFRIRISSVMPGSKGYSLLLDSDSRFGATGRLPVNPSVVAELNASTKTTNSC